MPSAMPSALPPAMLPASTPAPTAASTAAPTAPGKRSWLWRYIATERSALLAGSVMSVLRSVVLLLTPWPLKFIFDSVLFRHPLPTALAGWLPNPAADRVALLDALVSAMIGLGLIEAALVYGGNRLLLNAGNRVVVNVRADLFAHLQRMDLGFHRRTQGGELMTRVGSDVRQLQDLVAAIGIDFLPHALTIIGMVAVMTWVNWRYALFAVVVAPVLFFVARHYAASLRNALREVRHQEGILWSAAQEVFGALHVVQAFAREDREDRRFGRLAEKGLAANEAANEAQARFGPVISVVLAVATGTVAWYGARGVVRGDLTAGELLVFMAYVNRMATPARQLAKTGRVFGRSIVALERIGECFALRSRVEDRSDAITPDTCQGKVELRNVSFGYVPDEPVLHDISLTIEPGKTIALVGETGSGKSTIAGLIPRFHDPDSGSVLLDGRDLRNLRLGFVRRNVATVHQEPVLFRASIWENIAYGSDAANHEDARADAIEAARRVGVAPVFEQLPDGFDTIVGERGGTLSGGQRQCVAIARAMLTDAPVVLLDEPSSSLDPATERRVMAALRHLAKGRAALVIAHRLETVVQADRIVVIQRGRIVERGTHSELLARDGAYGRLWCALLHGEDSVPSPQGALP